MKSFAGRGLACIRGERLVFQGLDFSLVPGGALVLRGPNGAGKTSLLRLMAGLARPAAGEIRWNGRPAHADREEFNGAIHFLGHRDAVKPALTVMENLAFHARLRSAVREEELMGALRCMNIAALADLPTRFLSAGQTRRLALARAFAAAAPLWLLDEPAASLDSAAAATVAKAIARHCADGGMAVVSTNVPLDLDGASLDVSDYAPSPDDPQ